MHDQIKNVLIGLFVIAACAILVFLLMFLHPKVGDEAKQYLVRFANIDKITKGTRVTYGGKPAGEVVDIRELEDVHRPRENKNGYVYVYELTLAVDSNVDIYNTDDISLRTSGLLGDKSVAITPRPPKQGQKLVKITNEILYANESGSVEETLKEFKELSDKFEQALDAIVDAFSTIKQEKLWKKFGDTATTIGEATVTIDATAHNLKSITHSIDKPVDLGDTVTNVHQLSQKVNRSWDNVNHCINNISTASDDVVGTCQDIRKIAYDGRCLVEKICRGEGTAGQVLVNDDLYLRAVAIMNKAETLIDDVNHYGLLFHLDKGWQRLRARRANLLAKLNSPQEFRNYFNDEMNQINTSLARVGQVMQETQWNCDPQTLACDEDFAKVFAELLRRVDGLEKSLQMYNDQLQDIRAQETELPPCYPASAPCYPCPPLKLNNY